MSLVDIEVCKANVRVQSAAEDSLFTIWRAEAIAAVQLYVRQKIEAHLRTFTLKRPECCVTDTIILPLYPVSAAVDAESDADDIAALVLTDADGDAVDVGDYSIDYRTGVISAAADVTFANYPYTVVATFGVATHPDYAEMYEPAINGWILDYTADKWNRRNPAATQESEGGGVGTGYAQVGMPKRMLDLLEPVRLVRAL